MSKERPILFNSEMVRAVLEGRKTQTRRVCKIPDLFSPRAFKDGIVDVFPDGSILCDYDFSTEEVKSPYGKIGDRLWVRETFSKFEGAPNGVAYRADCVGEFEDLQDSLKPWKPSIFMKREFSRILLEVTDVRVERVQDIDFFDAQDEGCPKKAEHCPITWFSLLWESINKIRGYGWEVNPWVWVVRFKVLELKGSSDE